MKPRSLRALPLAAGLLGALLLGSLGEPVLAQRGGNKPPAPGTGSGNPGNGPNPSRGNAGRNSGVTTTTSSTLVPTVRFAPTPTSP